MAVYCRHIIHTFHFSYCRTYISDIANILPLRSAIVRSLSYKTSQRNKRSLFSSIIKELTQKQVLADTEEDLEGLKLRNDFGLCYSHQKLRYIYAS
jgi:hypothetical protein